MRADEISIESDEHGFELHVTDEEGERHVFNIHGVAEELYDAVKRDIGSWLQEGAAARASYRPDTLTDAEREEEVRCAALGMEGPNAKQYRYEASL